MKKEEEEECFQPKYLRNLLGSKHDLTMMTRASFCCTKILKKLHLFLTKVDLKSCIYF